MPSRRPPVAAASTTPANAFGGLVRIEVPDKQQGLPGSTLAGAVEAPLFLLGKTTGDQWQFMIRFSKAAGKNPAPFFQARGLPLSAASASEVASPPRWMPEDLARVMALAIPFANADPHGVPPALGQDGADFPMPDSFITSTAAGWRLEHSYAALPPLFHTQTQPGAVRAPHLVVFNTPLASSLGLNPETLAQPGSAALFAGNVLPEGAHPIAQAYAGHQFGHFTTLGDGRAILLGEQITPVGERFDIQLKGAGLTPFSRGGDGRAALGPMLREYLISEAMHALGIPTTRSLAVALTGEPVLRRQRLDGAVLTRVAASHIRVGTFEWAAAQSDPAALRALAGYTIHRHYPDLAEAQNPYLEFLEAVMERQASLIAQWLQVGFIHGVMNTDNMALSGETIDYGPCAFMDAYDPATVFSSIDQQGRYAYGNQPLMAQWNLARLAETLLPLLHDDEARAIDLANAAIQSFETRYEHHRLAGMRRKLGLFTEEADDSALIEDLLKWMQDHEADFTNTFRDLSAGTPLPEDAADQADFSSWHQRWRARRSRQPQSVAESRRLMQAHNPAFIPRNHKVEEALAAAVEHRDFSVLQRLLGVLAKPFDYTADQPGYQTPPATAACAYQTFCGT